MIKTRLRFFCFHRKYLSLFLLFILNHTFYANTSNTDGVFTKTDGATIKLEDGAFLHIETENTSQKENAKIYVVGGIIIKNISEITNAEVVHTDTVNKLSTPKKIRKQDHNRIKKNKKIVQQKNSADKVKTYVLTDYSSAIFQSFGENGIQFTLPTQNSPKTIAILNKTIAIIFDENFNNTNSFFFNDSNQFSSFNPDFSVRPPPSKG